MKQRSKSRGAAAKSGRSDKSPPKQRKSARTGAAKTKAAAGANPGLQIAPLTGELHQARQRQTATSEVLRLISSTREDLNSIFEAILENATRICEAKFGLMYSYDGQMFHNAAMRNAPQALMEFHRKRGSFEPGPGTPLDRLLKTKDVVSSADDSTLQAPSAPTRLAGAKSHLAVPMFKGERVVGAIVIYRQEIRPFTEQQIELVRDFAAQAVIAIENARLLSELRESLQQQTASADVLRTISSSPGELEPIFQSMLMNAMRLCEAEFGHLLLYDGECFRAAHLHNLPPAYRRFWEQGPVRVSTKLALGRLPQTKEVVQITDMKADSAYLDGDPLRVATVDLGGAQTLLCVPMLKENQLVGAIVIYRQEKRPFTDKQVELVTTFADQAVIAIENARLLNELRESLQQQTASADVLRIISSSPGELEPVFGAILKNAVSLCEATLGNLFLYNGEDYISAAVHTSSPNYAASRRPGLVVRHLHPDVPLNQITRTKELIHIADVRTAKAYIDRDPVFCELVEGGGARTLLVVPILTVRWRGRSRSIAKRSVRSPTPRSRWSETLLLRP